MAGKSALENKQQVHSRSISLPARLHPNSLKIEEELSKIKSYRESSLALTPISSDAESIQIGLVMMAELYNSIEELVHSSCPQQVLRNQQHKNLVEEALENSVELLDACRNARDLILKMKGQVQDLQSALRRRGGDSILESNVHAYIGFRKRSRKNIAKCFKALKKTENKILSSNMVNVDVHDQHLSAVIKVLGESSSITVSIFRSILLFLSMPEMKTKNGGWSLIRKLIPVPSSERSSGKQIFNEVASVDFAVHSLHGQIQKSDHAKDDMQAALRRLQTLASGIKNVDTGLDCLFRRLIQNRVSLLNILTP